MRAPLNTEYRTLIVYFIIHVSISPQIKVYSSKFVIKFLTPVILPIPKIRRRWTHRVIHSSIPELSTENLANNLAER